MVVFDSVGQGDAFGLTPVGNDDGDGICTRALFQKIVDGDKSFFWSSPRNIDFVTCAFWGFGIHVDSFNLFDDDGQFVVAFVDPSGNQERFVDYPKIGGIRVKIGENDQINGGGIILKRSKAHPGVIFLRIYGADRSENAGYGDVLTDVIIRVELADFVGDAVGDNFDGVLHGVVGQIEAEKSFFGFEKFGHGHFGDIRKIVGQSMTGLLFCHTIEETSLTGRFLAAAGGSLISDFVVGGIKLGASTKTIKGAGTNERFKDTFVHFRKIGAVNEISQTGKWTRGSGGKNGGDSRIANVLDGRKTKTNRFPLLSSAADL